MLVRVDGMVWLQKSEADPALLRYLRDQLMVVPRKFQEYDDVDPAPIACFQENAGEFGVPRRWWFDHTRTSHRYQWKVCFGSPIELESRLRFDGVYREQEVVVNTFHEYFGTARLGIEQNVYCDVSTSCRIGRQIGGIFKATTGFGKTNVALEIIRRLGVTTVVLVHKEMLLQQWVERINKWLPGARVGVVREKKCEFEGKDIVIAMEQSLAREDGSRYPKDFYDNFAGLVIADEVHRVSAPTFAPLLPRFRAAYRLGLSATPRRKDNTDNVFWWNIGPVVYSAKTEMPKPGIRLMAVPARREHMGNLTNPDLSSGVVINMLAYSFQRNRFIMQQIIKALLSPQRRKLLVLSERIEHLRKLDQLFHEAKAQVEGLDDVTTGFYVGQWFTGEVVEKLSPGTWPMENGGRQEAIKILYNSLSRRKRKGCDVTKDCFIAEVPPQLVSRPWTEFSVVATKAMKTKELRKVHVVVYEDASLPFLARFSWYSPDEHKPVALALEALTNEELFQVASYYGIQQKQKDKRKTLTQEQLRRAERKRLIFATYQIIAEGIDIPAADTLVFATPMSDVEQAAGRIRRFCLPNPDDPEKCEHFCPWRAEDCPGKAPPVICDIVDSLVPLGSRRVGYRKEFYLGSGFTVWEG